MMKFFSWVILGVVFIVFLFFSHILTLVADWWFFQEVGLTEIFITSFASKSILFLLGFVVVALFLGVNFLIASYSKTEWLASIPEALMGKSLTLNKDKTRKIALIGSLAISIFFGFILAGNWHEILKFLNIFSFGDIDPIFKKDISFYIFSLPVFDLVLGCLRTVVLISLAGCVLIYFLRGRFSFSSFLPKIDWEKLGLPKLKITKTKEGEYQARLHLGILIFLFLLITAASTYLSLFKLLTSQSGPVVGVAYTDVTFMIPLIKISALLLFGLAIAALIWGIAGKLVPLTVMASFYVLFMLISSIVPSIFQKLIVAPNELVKETPFIKYHIKATQKAFNLDKSEEREILGDKPLTASDISANNLTIKNVRLWDRGPLLSTFSQIQEIRTYYEFNSVDNDRYILGGEIRQIMLSPRELVSEALPAKTWINERLTFTHGYGVAAGPVNQVTAEGLPVLFIKDLPPKSEIKELAVERPEIYYGELPNDYVIVKTKAKEFNYPKGEENVFATYQGKGGVEIGNLWRRILYTIRFGSLKILLSNDITSESRIMYYRRIEERIQKIAPFFEYDRDPYLVVAEGKLYWIVDGYTTSSLYPYAQSISFNQGKINYIRNSVKAVVDAYEGKITFYIADNNDPIIKTYAKIFPKTFQPLTSMPQDLKVHIRYPEDIFTLQTVIYTVYHMKEPQIFYNKEDQWEIPTITQQETDGNGEKSSAMAPRHMIMKLPGERKEEYILMLPFTPRGKDNLAAWMVARNDGANYGKLLVYRFPKQKLIFGPKQIMGRINQEAEISRQISLWDQRGSQVIQGPLLVIPIEESLIYVRPLYIKAETGKIPELKRVILAYENKISMEETLEEGLSRIFGEKPQEQPIISEVKSTPVDKQLLIKQAQESYEMAVRAQKEGNWTKYGEEIKKLGEILNQ